MKFSFVFISVLFISIIVLFFITTSQRNVRFFPFFNRYSNKLPDYVLNYKQPFNLPIHCVPYSTMRGKIPICIHENRETITNAILKTGVWEKEHGDSIQRILYENPDYGLIDIGTNLGMFSLLAANLKRPVLAVEALDINIDKLHQSVVINRFEEYITLVTKPLSDKHETVKFIVSRVNLGMTMLIQKQAPKMRGVLHYENKTALTLDDLIILMPRKKAVMVMDVEGNEGKVLRGGFGFFDAINITHVLMEWIHLPLKEREYVLDFFAKRGYVPYNSPKFKTELDTSKFNRWGYNVFWKK